MVTMATPPSAQARRPGRSALALDGAELGELDIKVGKPGA